MNQLQMEPCKKTKFINEEHAQAFIDRLKKTAKKKVLINSCYLCDKCLCWHLTKQKQESDYHEELKNKKKELAWANQRAGEMKKMNKRLLYELSKFTNVDALLFKLKNVKLRR